MKECVACKELKFISEYPPDKRQSDGRMGRCRPCARARRKELYYINPDRQRKASVKNRYGISAENWYRLFAEQEGKCLGCQRHQSELPDTLCVDHNHATGNIRGLLCRKCNAALGLLRDNKETLARLQAYLERPELILVANES